MANNDEEVFYVLINDEEQYSLWPVSIDIPKGWIKNFSGRKDECLQHINEIWIDMRPKSIRD